MRHPLIMREMPTMLLYGFQKLLTIGTRTTELIYSTHLYLNQQVKFNSNNIFHSFYSQVTPDHPLNMVQQITTLLLFYIIIQPHNTSAAFERSTACLESHIVWFVRQPIMTIQTIQWNVGPDVSNVQKWPTDFSAHVNLF